MIKVGGLDFAPDELGIADDDQDFDTEITLPKPPVIIKDEVFQRVAAIAGWSDVRLWFNDADRDTYIGTRANSSKGIFIPRYDRSIDAIWAVYEEFDLFPTVERLSHDGRILYRATLFSGIAPESYISLISLPMALCNLLIAIAAKIE